MQIFTDEQRRKMENNLEKKFQEKIMSKKTKKTIEPVQEETQGQETNEQVQEETQGQETTEQVQEETQGQQNQDEPRQKKWSFPTVSKCPRCGTTDTICRRTDINLGRQYRQCQRAICHHKYSIDGQII